jgi:transposase
LAWFEGQLLLDPARLIFIDETGATTNMARRCGRCKRGKRLRAAVPHGHYKTLTLVSGLRLGGLVAPRVLDGPMNAERFEAWLRDDLGPTLSAGDTVVMDNLPSHKSERVKSTLERFGASVLYLPPYSPDLNPIEKAYAKLKAHLRKLAERTVPGLMALLEACADIFNPTEAENFFAACGYDTD